LSQWGQEPVPPEVKIGPTIDMKTPPKVQVDTMPADKFFAYAADLLKLHPPHITDQPIIARLERVGFEVGKSFDLDQAKPAIKAGLERAPEAAQTLMQWKIPTMARIANGWSMNTDTMGVYGNYYLKRAMVAQVGLGANVPEDAIYPLNLADDTGKPLSRSAVYSFAIASRSPDIAVLNGSTLASSGFALTRAGTRSRQYSTWVYIGCSTHSVPS
jgi:hypothetical protein